MPENITLQARITAPDNIPLIGEQRPYVEFKFHPAMLPEQVDTFEIFMSRLMLAFYPADLAGMVICTPAFIQLWPVDIQRDFAAVPGRGFKFPVADLRSFRDLGYVITRKTDDLPAETMEISDITTPNAS